MSELLSHPLFLTILCAGGGAQVVKIAIFFLKTGRIHVLDLVATGGMPSSHSALLSAITTAIYLREGLTTSFFVALAVASVVIIGAFGVRRTAGEEGRILHQLIRKVQLRIREPHYSLGHTPGQVLAGVLFGILVAALIN